MIHKNSSQIIVEELGNNCETCGHCCTYGSGIILLQEIEKIASYLKITKKEFEESFTENVEFFSKQHKRFKQNRKDKLPHGSCVFLEKNECKINPVKPLYCRIGNCGAYANEAIQWFHLNYSVDKFNPNSIREWKIFTDNKKVIDGGKVEEIVQDKEVLKKILNYEIL